MPARPRGAGSFNGEALLAALRAAYAAEGDPKRARDLQACMKSKLPFHGVPMPRTRASSRRMVQGRGASALARGQVPRGALRGAGAAGPALGAEAGDARGTAAVRGADPHRRVVGSGGRARRAPGGRRAGAGAEGGAGAAALEQGR
ncbi:MAG: DNA alkylation repair protein [Myxococcales bacterium]|nr:DNA alkylation repair protein [Myxococcales bacterium]